uniref:exodeoxyribonuclease III n=1 Tax=Latimeria chalumnae TaxID=7897 RepID=H3B1A1_LATCH
PKQEKNLKPVTTRLVTWNVRGINNPVKRYKILSHLTRLGADVVFLQEVHLTPTEMRKLRSRWVGQMYYSSYNSKSRGVCVLMSKTPFIELESESDTEGRFMIVRGVLQGTEVTMVSVYAPPQDITRSYPSTCKIVGGDWNTVWDTDLDRMGPSLPSDAATSCALREFSREMGLTDIWRVLHQGKKDYTFFSGAHQSYCWLDTLLISQQVGLGTLETSIHVKVLSDHSPVSMDFLPYPQIKRSITWRMNNSLLADKSFVSMLQQEISSFFQVNENTITSRLVLWDAFKATIRGWIIGQASYKKKLYKKEWLKLEEELVNLEIAHKDSPQNEEILSALQKTSRDMQGLINQKTEYALYRTRERYF